MARKRKNLNKKKNGGTGTKVGNLLRKASSTINSLANKNKASVAGAITSGPVGIPMTVAKIASNLLNKNKVNNLTKGFDFNNPVQNAINQDRTLQRNLNQPNMPDSGLFTAQKNQSKLNIVNAIKNFQQNRNSGGAGVQYGPDIPEGYVLGAEETIDAQGRSTGMGGQPVGGGGSYGGGVSKPSAPVTAPTPEFAKGGVANFRASAPASTGGGLSATLGQIGGGVKGEGIAGTAIKDDYYSNLLSQLEKDSQDNVDLKDIRRQNEQRAQAEINSINAIYSDLVGRAQRTGEESMGSERAMQARSGTLASSFGQGALQTQAENTNKNIGEIENQRASTIADVYARSNENALNEFQVMKQLKSQDFETYQAVQAQERSILDNGLNDMAEYIALQGLSAEDLDMEGLKKIAKDWKSTPQKVYNSIMAKQAELQQRDLDQREQQGEFDAKTKATTGGASNFGDFSDEAIAFSVLPTQLKNSDKEKEYFLEGIRQGLSEGLTPYEIADNLLGYKVNAPDQFSENIRPLIGESELTPQTIAQVAREINKGNRVKAMELVENSIMGRARKDMGSDFVSETFAKNSKQRSDEIIKMIENSQKSPVGVVSGTMAKWLGKLRGKEASKILADVTIATNQLRSKLAGSAVTDTELRYLDNFIPTINDKPDVFMYKLQKLKLDPLLQLNNIRQQYGIVGLDEESLMNKNLRVEDYYGMQSNAPQNTQSTSNSGGGGNWDW